MAVAGGKQAGADVYTYENVSLCLLSLIIIKNQILLSVEHAPQSFRWAEGQLCGPVQRAHKAVEWSEPGWRRGRGPGRERVISFVQPKKWDLSELRTVRK